MDSTEEECFGSDLRESQAQSQARPNKLCLEQKLGSRITIGHLALTDPIVSMASPFQTLISLQASPFLKAGVLKERNKINHIVSHIILFRLNYSYEN